MAREGNTIQLCGDGGGCRFPEELVIEILKRLPTATCIGRFRCVRKSWYHHLSDPNFVRSQNRDHTTRVMITSSSNFKEVGRRNCNNAEATTISYDTLQPTSPESLLKRLVPEVKLLQYESPTIGGCCDGIFCLYETHLDSKVIIWNPTTSDRLALPLLDYALYTEHLQVQPQVRQIGFAFDPKTNDYKVVIVIGPAQSSLGTDLPAYIYSLKNGSWKPIQSRCYDTGTEVVKSDRINKCYWFCSGSTWSINEFDMSEEAFNKVALPPEPEHADLKQSCMYMFKNSLMAISGGSIWRVLNYDKLECGWEKLFSIGDASFVTEVKDIRAVMWEEGRWFVVDSEGLQVIDVKEEDCYRNRKMVSKWVVCQVRAYIPSPLSLKHFYGSIHESDMLEGDCGDSVFLQLQCSCSI